jgi:hypothetical protein
VKIMKMVICAMKNFIFSRILKMIVNKYFYIGYFYKDLSMKIIYYKEKEIIIERSRISPLFRNVV